MRSLYSYGSMEPMEALTVGNRMRPVINKKLVPVKGHYFLFNAGTAPLVPYLSPYARQLGFSSYIVGIIYTVLPITGLIAKPLFGAIADKYKQQKTLLVLFATITACSFLAIYFIPQQGNEIKIDLSCRNGSAYIKTCYASDADVNGCLINRIVNETSSASCTLTCTRREDFDATGSLHESSNVLTINTQVPLRNTVLESSCVYFGLMNTPNSGPWFSCDEVDGVIAYDNAPINSTCSLECNSLLINEVLDATYVGLSEDYSTLLALFFSLMIINWVGQAVVVSVADAVCFDLLDDRPSFYGRQRLWGSIGFGIFSLMTGVLIDSASGGSVVKNYTIAFILSFAFMIGDAICCYTIQYKPTVQSVSIARDVGLLLTSPHIILYLLWTVGVGLCTGLQWQFLSWHIEDVAANYSCESQAWTKTIQGLVSAVQTFGGEIPFLFISGTVLSKVGHTHMMSIILLAFGIRYILYYFLTNPWWVLPIELLQGITSGMFYPTMTSYASVVALPGTETTVQGLVGAVFEGVGASLGSYIGGLLYETYSGWNTFLWFGYGSLILCVVHFLLQHLLYKCVKKDYFPTRGNSVRKELNQS